MQNINCVIEELRQTCLVLQMRGAARAATNFANDLLRPADLNVAQLALLASVNGHPDKTLSALSDVLSIDESTLTRNLVVLERRALVRSEGGRGRGGKQVYLTAEGVSTLERGLKVWREMNERIVAEMSPEEIEAGRRFLGALRAAAERAFGPQAANPPAGARMDAAE